MTSLTGSARTWWSRASFNAVHQHRLVYNTCWEDPRLDRVALALTPEDHVVVITSAGCNVLDYALDGPRHISAVDVNPRQNALLELKLAGIRALDFEDFFALFGRGRHAEGRTLYRHHLREHLTPWSRQFWDRHVSYFDARRAGASFYFRGTTGRVARAMKTYLDHVAGARDDVLALLEAPTLDVQREAYARIRHRLFRPFVRWVLGRDALLALLAVPRPQREHLERDYPGGIAGFIEQRLDSVFTELPIADNYFWQVYLRGAYTEDCCPEYLKRPQFERLKAGLVDRISSHTMTVQQFLSTTPAGEAAPVTRLVLLDHMDWLCEGDPAGLGGEWQAIVDRAAPGARILWRSGGRQTPFVDAVQVHVRGTTRRVGDMLSYATGLARELHQLDRVRTYGSFFVADLTC